MRRDAPFAIAKGGLKRSGEKTKSDLKQLLSRQLGLSETSFVAIIFPLLRW